MIFDCLINDQYSFLTGLSLIILDKDDNILAELTPQDGLQINAVNYDCYFYMLKPNSDYEIIVVADYETYDMIYTTQTLAEYSFTTWNYQFEPKGEIYINEIKNDTVSFSCRLTDPYGLLTGVSIVLVRNGVVEKVIDGLQIGDNYGLKFTGMVGNSDYYIIVIANYIAYGNQYTGVYIGEQKIKSGNVTLINSKADLINIKNNLDGFYILNCDIDLSGSEWAPIGTESAPFTGILNGNGYTISNLTIITNTYDYVGLFGYISNTDVFSSGAYIYNLVLSNVNIQFTGKLNQNIYAGGLVGQGGNLTISNCYNTGDISSLSSVSTYAGGLAGEIYTATITSCYNYGTISVASSGASSALAGGLVGYSKYGTYENCLSLGQVNSETTGVIVARHGDSDFINCYYYGFSADETNSSALATISQLNSKSFYVSTLNWDVDVWSLDNLSYVNGILPTLK